MPPLTTAPAEDDPDDAYISAEDEDFRPEDQMSVDSNSDDERKASKASRPSKSSPQKPKPADGVGKIDRTEVEGLISDAGVKKPSVAESQDDTFVVQTRSMAAQASDTKVRKPLVSENGATVDVDALWARLNSEPTFEPVRQEQRANSSGAGVTGVGAETTSNDISTAISTTGTGGITDTTTTTTTTEAAPSAAADPHEMVPITETYRFAGELHTRTKMVPRSEASKETDQQTETKQKLTPTGKPLLRPLRRVSAFEPNPQGNVKHLPLKPGEEPRQHAGLGGAHSKNKNKMGRHAYAIPAVKSVKKLNVVDKSKLDWYAHVDEMGQRDELNQAAKEKGNFLERRDFLERVEGREDLRRLEAKAK